MSVSSGIAHCPGCNTELAPTLKSCPACGRLVHAAALKTLAAQAASAEAAGDLATARASLEKALPLLPPSSRQAQVIAAQIEALAKRGAVSGAGSAEPQAHPVTTANPTGLAVWLRRLGPLGVVLVFVLSKLKLLALGLTQLSTLLTMLLSFGVYWTAYSWRFALGLVVSIYVHEMGHVAALRYYGVPASAPMFLPGIGAVVRLHRNPSTPVENARTGLAGPLWGLAAALVCEGIFRATGGPLYAALARIGAWINLFNLLPLWQLDGGRGFVSLSRTERLFAAAVVFLAWLWTHEGLLMLIFLCALFQAAAKRTEATSDRPGLGLYAALIVALTWLMQLHAAG